MANNHNDEILELLKRVQADIANIRDRLARLEDVSRRQRRDLSGMLVMLRGRDDDFKEQVDEIESIMDELDPPPVH